MSIYISIDLGAESGRMVRGTLNAGKLTLDEAARFPNAMVRMQGRLYWNLTSLFSEIKQSMGSTTRPECIAVDAWGVDFVLLSSDGSPAGLPVTYRDSRTDGMMEKFFEIMPREKIYKKTGTQFMQINTLFQLFAMSQQKSPQLESATDLLFIPDYFNYLLTGEKCTEFTIATTSQLFNVTKNAWDEELLKAVGVSPSLMQRIIQPGEVVGKLSAEMQEETKIGDIPVIAAGSHDTASAVAAIPAEGADWAYISSGTWSLMGIETKSPILTKEAEQFNFTNEGGVNGTYRFLKNIMGLWLVQRIRVDYKGRHDYKDLANLASESEPFANVIDVNDPRFLNPTSMIKTIEEFWKETGQPVTKTPGAYVRCALESLAVYYRITLDQLRQAQKTPINRIHVIGGGTKNKLLCQMTADATGLAVLAGPSEATAIGNIILQAQTLGHIGSLAEGRDIIRKSFEFDEYKPVATDAWGAAAERYLSIAKTS